MQRAIIYLRVSTEEQVKGYSLDDQRDKCTAKAYELGCDDTIVFEEAGVSGEIATRPALMDAISAVQSASYFICTDPDRLSRNNTNLLVLTEQIERKAKLVFVNFNREATPEGDLFYSIRGAIAQFEKALIRRRTMMGKLRAAHEGKFPHWPGIYGYDYNEGTVTVNENEAKIVRLIFEYGATMGVSGIVQRLSDINVLSPRAKKSAWSKTTVRRILENETYYTGIVTVRRYNTEKTHLNRYISNPDEKHKRSFRPHEEWIEIPIPTIITEQSYIAVERRLTNARRKFDGTSKNRYLLSGLIRCGHCNHTWHGFHSQGSRHSYYVCTMRSPGPRKGSNTERCIAGFRQCDEIDNAIWQIVLGWIKSNKMVNAFNESRTAQTKFTNQSELEILRIREQELSDEEDVYLARLSKERNPRLRDKIDIQLTSISSQLDHVKTQIRELSSDESAATVNQSIVESIRIELPNPDDATWDERYGAIHRLIREITITVDGERRITIELTPIS